MLTPEDARLSEVAALQAAKLSRLADEIEQALGEGEAN